jgi:hypothetical protein
MGFVNNHLDMDLCLGIETYLYLSRCNGMVKPMVNLSTNANMKNAILDERDILMNYAMRITHDIT